MSSGAHPTEGMHVTDDTVLIMASESHVAVARDPLCGLEAIAKASGPLSILSKIRRGYEPAHFRRVLWPLACCPYCKVWGIG